jgi:8-oxo-dGTP pyrophosphatase MutT (NUDIX family)
MQLVHTTGRERWFMSDGRDRLDALLSTHRPADDAERADLAMMRRLLLELPRPLSRAEPEAHFTASAIVTNAGGTHTCLVHHRRLGRWLQPGGHFEAADGGRADIAALREVLEETGCTAVLHAAAPAPLDVDVHTIPATATTPEHLHLDVRFLVVTAEATPVRHDPAESLAAKWFTWAQALELASDPALVRALGKAAAAGAAAATPAASEAAATAPEI